MGSFKQSLEIINLDASSQRGGGLTWQPATRFGGETPGRSHDNPIVLDEWFDDPALIQQPAKKPSRSSRCGNQSYCAYRGEHFHLLLPDETAMPAKKRRRVACDNGQRALPNDHSSDTSRYGGPTTTKTEILLLVADEPPELVPPPDIVRILNKSRGARHPRFSFIPIPFP